LVSLCANKYNNSFRVDRPAGKMPGAQPQFMNLMVDALFISEMVFSGLCQLVAFIPEKATIACNH